MSSNYHLLNELCIDNNSTSILSNSKFLIPNSNTYQTQYLDNAANVIHSFNNTKILPMYSEKDKILEYPTELKYNMGDLQQNIQNNIENKDFKNKLLDKPSQVSSLETLLNSNSLTNSIDMVNAEQNNIFSPEHPPFIDQVNNIPLNKRNSQKIIKENYPVECTFCTQGSANISGASFYDINDTSENRISQDMCDNPTNCYTTPNFRYGQQIPSCIKNPLLNKKLLPGVGGEGLVDEKNRIKNFDPLIIREKYTSMIDLTKKKLDSNNLINIVKAPYCSDSSNVLLNKKIWGPKFWEVMHMVSFSYPHHPTLEEKNAAYNFYTSIAYLLPCKLCGQHCKENILENPPNVNSKYDLIKWCLDLHNMVNKQTGKSLLTYNEIKMNYIINNI